MKKLIKPEPPVDYEMKSISIYLYQGKSLQEVLNDLPEEIDKTELKFDVSASYYDDFDYVFIGSYKQKLTEKEYARKVMFYEKALKKYEKELEKEGNNGK